MGGNMILFRRQILGRCTQNILLGYWAARKVSAKVLCFYSTFKIQADRGHSDKNQEEKENTNHDKTEQYKFFFLNLDWQEMQ